MVVLGWDTPPGGGLNKPDEGNEFVAVELVLVNKGEDPASVSSMMQMILKDETGQRYSLDFAGSKAAGGRPPDGELAPGERLRGKVGFQIPKEAKGLVFVFDAQVLGTGKVLVDLGPEPVALEPPAEILGERPLTMFSVGDIVEIGELTLALNEVTYPSGADFNKPQEGHRFVVVDVTLENKGSEAKRISSLTQMHLKDETGQTYSLDQGACVASKGTTPDGEIAPGENIRGQVGYQVPEGAKGLLFVFDARAFGYGKVFVQLP